MGTDTEHKGLVKTVFQDIPMSCGFMFALFSLGLLAKEGFMGGAAYHDPFVEGKILHYRTLVYFFTSFTSVLYRWRDRLEPSTVFFFGVTVAMGGHALMEVIHHLFGWKIIVFRYGWVNWLKDMAIYGSILCMAIPLYHKLDLSNVRGVALLLTLVLSVAWIRYYVIWDRELAHAGVYEENVDISTIPDVAKSKMMQDRFVMNVFKFVCFTPLLYWVICREP